MNLSKKLWLVMWHIVALIFVYLFLFTPVYTCAIRIGSLRIPLGIIACGIVAISPLFYWVKKFVKIDKANILKILKICGIPACVLLLLGGVGFGIYKGIEANSLPACDSSYAEERLINYYNKEIRGIFNANNVEVSLPVIESYDKEIKKYECKADITISYHSDHVPYLNGNSGDMIYDCISYYDIQKSKGEIVMFFSEPKSCTLNWASWNY